LQDLPQKKETHKELHFLTVTTACNFTP